MNSSVSIRHGRTQQAGLESSHVGNLPREPDRTELVGATRRCAPYSFNLGCGSFSFPLQLDPTVALDQQDAYIKHLQELRRINEGDDTADGPERQAGAKRKTTELTLPPADPAPFPACPAHHFVAGSESAPGSHKLRQEGLRRFRVVRTRPLPPERPCAHRRSWTGFVNKHSRSPFRCRVRICRSPTPLDALGMPVTWRV